MNLGADDPKKLGILIALMGAAGVLFYINSGSDTPSTPSSGNASAAVPANNVSIPPLTAGRPGAATSGRKISRRISGDEFKPSLRIRPEDAPDLARIDPTLRLDLLAKVQGVDRGAGVRNLFQFGAAPPPPAAEAPKVKVVPGAKSEAEGGVNAAAAKPSGPPPPSAPPIPLKFYGYTEPLAAGAKRAFFLEGEEIYVGGEGELINKRYKVIRISPGSVVMEDTQFKQQQTLVIQQEVG